MLGELNFIAKLYYSFVKSYIYIEIVIRLSRDNTNLPLQSYDSLLIKLISVKICRISSRPPFVGSPLTCPVSDPLASASQIAVQIYHKVMKLI